MSNQENNKLIAEFMGLAPNECGVYQTKRGPYHLENLSYHLSWDWLMDVVDEIKDMGCEIVTTNGKCTISGANDYYGESIGKSRRGATYDAIVEFINEYNKNK